MTSTATTQERPPSARAKQLVSTNPATLEEVGRYDLLSAEEVRAKVLQAADAFRGWAARPLAERAQMIGRARDYLIEHLDEIAGTISTEMGKPRAEAMSADLMTTAGLMSWIIRKSPEFLGDEPIAMDLLRGLKSSKIAYRPHGVVSIVSPWNFPFAIPMSGIVFALVAGNTVVLKPSSLVPAVARKIEEVLNRGGGLPAGVFQVILARGQETGDSLFAPPVRKIVFTGSTEVGKKVAAAAARHLIPTVLELGGKCPMVVLEDADLELTANAAVWGAFTNCGQVCASVERCYVHRSVFDRFVDAVVKRTERLRVGRDADHDVDVGPLVSADQLAIVESHVEDAKRRGAKVHCGGRRLEGAKGYFYEPTVLTGVDPRALVMTEETFGPVLPITPFDDVEEAVRLANDTKYGLTASVFSADVKKAEALARRIEAGTVMINDCVYSYGLYEAPWQGMKESGLGRSHARLGFHEFVYPQHINVDHAPAFVKRRPWWYPYSAAGYQAMKLLTRGVFHGSYVEKARALAKACRRIALDREFRRSLM